MTAMKRLSDKHKLPARTTPELYERVSNLVTRMASSEGITFQDRKLTTEAFIGAVLIDFLERPESEQLRLVRSNVRRFERNLEGEALAAMLGSHSEDTTGQMKVEDTTRPKTRKNDRPGPSNSKGKATG